MPDRIGLNNLLITDSLFGMWKILELRPGIYVLLPHIVQDIRNGSRIVNIPTAHLRLERIRSYTAIRVWDVDIVHFHIDRARYQNSDLCFVIQDVA